MNQKNLEIIDKMILKAKLRFLDKNLEIKEAYADIQNQIEFRLSEYIERKEKFALERLISNEIFQNDLEYEKIEKLIYFLNLYDKLDLDFEEIIKNLLKKYQNQCES